MFGISALRRRHDTEKELVAAARNHDEVAIRSLIRAHNRMLFHIARSVLPTDDEAEDAVQAAYVRAFNWARPAPAAEPDDRCLGRVARRRGDPFPTVQSISGPGTQDGATADPAHRRAGD